LGVVDVLQPDYVLLTNKGNIAITLNLHPPPQEIALAEAGERFVEFTKA